MPWPPARKPARPPPARSTTSAALPPIAPPWPGSSPAARSLSPPNAPLRGIETMSRLHVTTTVNGDPQDFLCAPGATLLDVLRDELGMTGSKEGCGSGD